MTWNPIFIKYARTRLRKNEAPFRYGSLVFLNLLITYGTSVFSGGFLEVTRTAFGFNLILTAMYLFLFFSLSTSTSQLAQLTASGIMDFHRISPQTPAGIVFGFYTGSLIQPFLVFLVYFPFLFFLGWKADYAASGLLLYFISLTLTICFLQMFLVAFGLSTRGTLANTAGIISLLSVLSLAGAVLRSVKPLSYLFVTTFYSIESYQADFFGVSVPTLLIQALYQVSLGAFAFHYAWRSLRYGIGYVYSKKAALLLLATLSVLMLGGTQYPPDSTGLVTVFAILLSFLLFRLAIPLRSQILSGQRLAAKKKRKVYPWEDRAPGWGYAGAVSLLFIGFALVWARLNAPAISRTEFIGMLMFWVFTLFQGACLDQYFKLRFDNRWRRYFWMGPFLLWALPAIVWTIGIKATGADPEASVFFSGLISICAPLSALELANHAELVWIDPIVGVVVCVGTFALSFKAYKETIKIE